MPTAAAAAAAAATTAVAAGGRGAGTRSRGSGGFVVPLRGRAAWWLATTATRARHGRQRGTQVGDQRHHGAGAASANAAPNTGCATQRRSIPAT